MTYMEKTRRRVGFDQLLLLLAASTRNEERPWKRAQEVHRRPEGDLEARYKARFKVIPSSHFPSCSDVIGSDSWKSPIGGEIAPGYWGGESLDAGQRRICFFKRFLAFPIGL